MTARAVFFSGDVISTNAITTCWALSSVHTVAENGEKTATVAEFLRQCGQGFTEIKANYSYSKPLNVT